MASGRWATNATETGFAPGAPGPGTAVRSALQAMRDNPVLRWATGIGIAALLCGAGAAVLPRGLPVGVILYGLVLGALSSLTAMGLVIVYRSARIINFAQAEIGGLAASVAVIVVVGEHQSYYLAVPAGLVTAVLTGALVDFFVIRRLFNTPRLIVTVATIGLAQILGAVELALPSMVGKVGPLTAFTSPFTFRQRIFPYLFTGDDVVAVGAVAVTICALGYFFGRSLLGVAIRGAADSGDRAELLGVPVRRLSTLTWMVAAALSGLGAILSGPILGPQLGVIGGPIELLAPLTAAVLGRMESLTTALVASLAIGVFEQAVYWSYPRASTVDVALFAVVLVGLLLQRRRITRADDSGLGGYVAVREVRRIPDSLRQLPEVRYARRALAGLGALAVIGVPLLASDSRRTLFAYVAIFGVIAVSLVVLTGWSGQISLGQFAFAGVGAATTASLYVHLHADLFVCLLLAAVAGAFTAVIVGVPAIRLPGLFLAAATMAFSVPVSTFLLNSTYFPRLDPSLLTRPAVLQRFDLNSPLTFCWFCTAVLLAAVALTRNYRATRPGRAAFAVRDNARGAAAFGVSPLRVRLTAFALAGALAGVGGGLYVVALKGLPFSGFPPELSFQVFAMVVVGGLGSVAGGIVGAFYVYGAQFFLHGSLQLLATGAGILLVVLVLPGGLADIGYRTRDRLLRRVATRRGLSVPSLAETAAYTLDDGAPDGGDGGPVARSAGPRSLLELHAVDAAYGAVPVLFGVDLSIGDGEIVGLLGTNGAGKSTVLRVASGLLGAKRGKVLYDGRDVTSLSPVERVKAGLVMVPSGRSTFPSLTVRDNLRLGGWLDRRNKPTVVETTARMLELFPALAQRLDTPAGSLSGGEQQMLSIAQALYCRPRLLMIDELSLGLAPAVVGQLLAVVRELAGRGVTVVIVEQSVNVATSIARRSVFMERGQVRYSGATADLAERPDLLRSIFLGEATPARTRVRGRPAQPVPAPSPSNAGPAFRVDGVGQRFGGLAALNEVSLHADRGEIVGIIGANGAGKTTLFDVCSGFLRPTSGTVHLGGVDVTEMPAHVRADLGLGRVFQDARLFPSLSVFEAISVAFERHVAVRDPLLSMLRTGPVRDSEADVAAGADRLIGRLGLERYRDAFISELSTGTRRMVELACVLAHEPAVLLLDEPTSGIAQRESEALGGLLLELRDQTGGTFLVIEHDVPLVSSIADRLVCLHLGEVLAEGPPGEVLDDPRVVAAYLGDDAAAISRSGSTGVRKSRVRRAPTDNGATPTSVRTAATVRDSVAAGQRQVTPRGGSR